MEISDYISERQIITGLSPADKKETLSQLLLPLIRVKKISPRSKKKILKALLDREKLGSTGIGKGVAIPHVKLGIIKKPLLVIGRSDKGIDFDAIDGELVYTILLILSPKDGNGLHLKIMARLSKLLKDKFLLNKLKGAKTPRQIKEIMKIYETKL